MVSIAVCEDNPKHQKDILDFLSKYEKQHQVEFQVLTYGDGIDLVSEYSFQFDLIFLDIEMKMMDGMEAAKRIREKDRDVILIFITNLAQYAIQGYEVEAKGFLLKPVRYIALEQQLGKCLQQIGAGGEEFLTVNFAGGMRRILLSDIYYMESEGHYLVIHSTEEKIRILSSIKDMESKVKDRHFIRCNSGTLVNLVHTKGVSQNELHIEGERLSISRARKKAFMEALTDYIGGSGL